MACNCLIYDVIIAQSDLNSSTGNTIYDNNTVIVDYINCSQVNTLNYYTEAGKYCDEICVSCTTNPSVYYFQDDVLVEAYDSYVVDTRVVCGPPASPTPTPTVTVTPSETQIICGSGVTTGNYYYVDCCGYFQTGTTAGVVVLMDYTKLYNGVTKLNVPATTTCPTPTPTKTPNPTPTPTPSITPSVTPTNTVTPTKTPYPTPSNSGVYVLRNECTVFTSFEMGLTCNVISYPSTQTSFDGILSLIVTGGTTPYYYYWDNGQRTQTIYDIPQGSYGVTVVDYYGDYTASTVCALMVITPTPSITPTQTVTPSITPTCTQLCLIATGGPITYGPWQFICNGNYNGKQKWTYNSQYNIIWSINNNRWEVVQNDLVTLVVFENSRVMISTSTSNIPLTNWSFFGTGSARYIFSVTEGACPSSLPLSYSVSITNNNCSDTQNCSGSIVVTTQGGLAPYQYSINNGLVYQTSNFFNNVCPGNYTLVVRDSLNSTLSQSVVIGSDGNNVTYEISVVTNGSNTYNPTQNSSYQTNNFVINVNPPLPVGTTITFNLVIDFEIQNQGPWFSDDPDVTASYIILPQVYKNAIDISGSIVTNPLTDVIVPRPGCYPSENKIINGSYVVSVSLTSGDSLTGEISCQINEDLPVELNNCVSTIASIINVSTTTPIISGCYCCNLTNNTQPIIYTQNLVGNV
jgi:hypothetical protein